MIHLTMIHLIKKKWKQNKSKIPAAPLPPPPPAGSSLTKSLSCASEKSIMKVVSNRKQRKTSSASTSTAINHHEPHQLLDKIVNLRQQAADKAQQRKQAMCFENIQKRKKATNSTLCSGLAVKVSKTDGSFRSETHSSPILLPINSQSEKSYSEMSNDIQSVLPQSPCRSLDENQNK